LPVTLTDLATLSAWDTIIDVRSPAEYAEDHLPDAINLPVLSDAERAHVGTIFKQDSPFTARKIGAALVARNAARHIEDSLMQHGGGWQPLVYCWRGGQRSGSFTSILQQIGWRADIVAGGYQSYRRMVSGRLYDQPLGLRIVRLDGYTGTAKTDLLARAALRGVQVIDLEGLAHHRGSILGDMDGPQPAQKGFESALLAQIMQFDPTRPVLVEAESSRIGRLRLPPGLWGAMQDSPRIVIAAPVPARAAYLAAAYADMAADATALAARLDGLRALAGHATVDGWLDLMRAGQMVDLAQALVLQHYDPAYARARKAQGGAVLETLKTETLDADALNRLADDIAEALRSG
jgi:tRNA 2-selenouridine synthase